MADNTRTDQWRWKGSSDQDRSRRDEINRHDGNQDNPVIYRKKNREQRRRREKMKKRWSVRPDVNLVMIPRGKQCKIITAVVFIFFGLFLAVAGLVVIFILKNISDVVWGVGIGMIILGIVVLIAGLFYMLCKCCFRTSTRYKQYKAQFKAGGKFEVSEASKQSPEMKSAPPKSNAKTQDSRQELGGSHGGHMSEQPSDATSRTYVTANEHSLSMPNASTRPGSTPQWNTPVGYRPMKVNDLSDYTTDMQTADEHNFDHSVVNGKNGTHTMGASSSDPTEQDALKDDFAKLEEVLREMVMNKSGEGEMAHLMRGPLDTSTPVNHRGHTHQRVHTVPIMIEGDHHGIHTVPIGGDHGVHTVPIMVEGDHHGVHTVPIVIEGDQGIHTVPIVVEGDHRATPPNPIPPSYDQVIRNYRTYSRSASPTRLMESDL